MKTYTHRFLTPFFAGVCLALLVAPPLGAVPKEGRAPLGGSTTLNRSPGANDRPGGSGTPPHNYQSSIDTPSSGPSTTFK
jgi:hypothetical protein